MGGEVDGDQLALALQLGERDGLAVVVDELVAEDGEGGHRLVCRARRVLAARVAQVQAPDETALREGFDLVDINMWLLVIPQVAVVKRSLNVDSSQR